MHSQFTSMALTAWRLRYRNRLLTSERNELDVQTRVYAGQRKILPISEPNGGLWDESRVLACDRCLVILHRGGLRSRQVEISCKLLIGPCHTGKCSHGKVFFFRSDESHSIVSTENFPRGVVWHNLQGGPKKYTTTKWSKNRIKACQWN